MLKYNYIYILFFNLLFLLTTANSQNCNCKYSIGLEQNNVDASSLSINPGDTVCITAGIRKVLRIVNFHGSELHKIVFVNCGAEVIVEGESPYNYGIDISNCSFFKFTGTGVTNTKYGIRILKTNTGASGLSIDHMSTDYEIDHLEIANTGFAGIFAFTQPTCMAAENRGNFVERNVSFHDNYVHNTHGEGFYVGHSFYGGYTLTCDGQATTVFPHDIKGIQVYNNKVDSTGWDGIQVSSADSACTIHDNIITNYGISRVNDQNSGIQIGGGTTGLCYNNAIINGSGTGISIFGLGNNLFFNNIIINPGIIGSTTDVNKIAYGIFCDDRTTIAGSYFSFMNNTIIAPKTDGIRIYSSLTSNNKIYNNLILRPGSFGNYKDYIQSYVYYNKDVDVQITNNYFSENLSPFLKLDNLDSIYNFTNTLPLSLKGINVSSYGISYDYFMKQRPLEGNCDIGAFQFDDKTNIETKNEIYVYPNPNFKKFMIVNNSNSKITNIDIFTYDGLKVFKQKVTKENSILINLGENIVKGFYLINIVTDKKHYVQSLIVK
jgi:hypothetical protein